MEYPWENPRKILGKSRENCGEILGKNLWKSLEKSWENPWKILGKSRE